MTNSASGLGRPSLSDGVLDNMSDFTARAKNSTKTNASGWLDNQEKSAFVFYALT
jgi:hypothetical protein